MAGELVKVPDLLRNWPWGRRLNSHYEQARTESLAWFTRFRAFDPNSQDAFDRCDFAKLAMLAYLYKDFARCRVGSDLMTLFYVFDEYTDVEDETVTRQMSQIIMDGLRNPNKARPEGECPLGEIARDFWARGRQVSAPMAERHFLETMQLYADAVTQQSEDRCHDRIRDIASYWQVRRHSSGCLPSFAAMEFEMDVPEEVYRHPLVEKLREDAMLLICAGNDLYSYPVERARGHALHNLVTAVMYQFNMGPQAAADWIGKWSDGIVKDFLQCKSELPSWGSDVDLQVSRYVDALAQWVRGNDDWSFESQRYFGVVGGVVRRVREIYMLPLVDVQDARSLAHRDEVDAESSGVAAMQIRRDLAV
ncbi:hypothetical protein OQA88_9543 [Cercophora sp. LCS_1]